MCLKELFLCHLVHPMGVNCIKTSVTSNSAMAECGIDHRTSNLEWSAKQHKSARQFLALRRRERPHCTKDKKEQVQALGEADGWTTGMGEPTTAATWQNTGCGIASGENNGTDGAKRHDRYCWSCKQQ